MNIYTPDGNFIVDASGNKYAVEKPYPLPLPAGIQTHHLAPMGASGSGFSIVFGGENLWGNQQEGDTHWLARRPLPPIPKPKTQRELDLEALAHFEATTPTTESGYSRSQIWCAAIAYARKEKP